MNIEETRRNKAAGCHVDLRQIFNKGLCRLKFGGRIRHTKENNVDSYALCRDDDADKPADKRWRTAGVWRVENHGEWDRIHSWHIRKRKTDLSYRK